VKPNIPMQKSGYLMRVEVVGLWEWWGFGSGGALAWARCINTYGHMVCVVGCTLLPKRQ